MAILSFLRLPRPKSFLGLSLQTGTEIITLILAFNKATGVYGLLAILTGFELSLLQLSTYLYSVIVLVALIYILPHIRRKSPLECLALAWIYIVDSAINCAYTTAFAVEWYLASTAAAEAHDHGEVTGGSSMQQDMSIGERDRVPSSHRHVVRAVPQDTALSLVLIAAFTLVRIYLSLVVAAYVQQVFQQYIERQLEQDDPRAKDADGPFVAESPDGEGWRGRLGRTMLSVGRGYWLDQGDQEEWARMMNERFRKTSRSTETADV